MRAYFTAVPTPNRELPPAARIDVILGGYRDALGPDHLGYRKHCQRLLRFMRLGGLDAAGGAFAGHFLPFHDLGVWTARTMDYLPPSIALARAYAKTEGLPYAPARITAFIGEHHRVRATADPLAERLRRADLTDLSFGLVRFGLAYGAVRDVYAALPRLGFQWGVYGKVVRHAVGHASAPLPMLRW